jgi:L-amino acid N-acyltransferase YncA
LVAILNGFLPGKGQVIPLIRLASSADTSAIADIYAPYVTDHATSFEYEPPDASEIVRRIEKLTARTPWLVCELNKEVVGYAYAGPHRDRAGYQWSVEVSAYVRQDQHRTGIARALYTSLLEILKLQGFRNAYAGATLPNDASVAFHRAMGFNEVATYRGVGFKFGKWHDVIWMERGLSPKTAETQPPIPLLEIRGTPAFAAAVKSGERFLRFADS